MKVRLIKISLILGMITLVVSCNKNSDSFDATGNFEAEEVIVSAEASGRILQFNIDEGQTVKEKEVVGYIDSVQLHLRKKQLQYSIRSVLSKQPDAVIQLSTIEQQITTAKREKLRVENLLKEDAATPKQLDDINAQLNLLEKQYSATKSTLSITSQGLYSETLPLRAQIEQLDDQIRRSMIINPINGTVLTKYAEENEMTATGKALYKISDLTNLFLRAYISGNQLSAIKPGQPVKVMIDDQKDSYKTYDGVITSIADKAEFTPKTIQTKDERANLVYAIRIKVKNDGFLKVGMYGEVKFDDQ